MALDREKIKQQALEIDRRQTQTSRPVASSVSTTTSKTTTPKTTTSKAKTQSAKSEEPNQRSKELRKQLNTAARESANTAEAKAYSQALARGVAVPRTELATKAYEFEAQNPEPSALERIGKTIRGGAKGSLASNVNAEANLYELGQGQRDALYDDIVQQKQRDLDRALSDMNVLVEMGANKKDISAQQNVIDSLRREISAYQTAKEAQRGATQETYKIADRIQESSSKDIERAKEGLGTLGSMVVDAGAAMTQVGLDAAGNVLTGGPSMLPFAFRAYGGGTQQARQEGASAGKAATYGLATAAKEVFTEKMFNVAMPFTKAYGGGALDDTVKSIINRAVNKVARTEVGKRLLGGGLTLATSGIGEGLEELVGDWIEWQMPRIYGGDVESASDTLAQSLYDFAVGGISGLMGGAVDLNTYNYRGQDVTANDIVNALAAEESAQTAEAQAIQDTARAEADIAAATDVAEVTAINDNPAQHTASEQRVIEEYKNSVNGGFLNWLNRVKTALANGDKSADKMRFILKDVNKNTADAIKAVSGIDTTGYKHMIDGSAVRHIEQRHGEHGRHDSTMKNIEDVARVEYVLDNFDNVDYLRNKNGDIKRSGQYRNKDNTPAPELIFRKKVNGTYYTVEAVPDSTDKTLHVVSAYMQKNSGSIIQELNMEQSSPQLTPEAPLGPVASATQTVSQPARTVNTQPITNPKQRAQAIVSGVVNKLTEQTAETTGRALGVAESTIQAAQEFSEKTGRKVLFKDYGNPKFKGEYNNGVIYLNSQTKTPILDTLIHELTHHAERGGVDYADFQNAVFESPLFNDFLNGQSLAELRNEIKETYAAQGVELSPNAVNQEITARFAEQVLFKNQESVDRLARRDSTLFDRVASWISYMKTQLTGTAAEKELARLERMYKRAKEKADATVNDLDNGNTAQTSGKLGQSAQYSIDSPLKDIPPNTGAELPSRAPAAQREGDRISSFAENVQNSTLVADEVKEAAASDANVVSYQGITNEETMKQAATTVDEAGALAANQFFNAAEGKSATAEDVAIGLTLLDRYQKAGDYKSALTVLEKLRKMGSTAGQAVQMFLLLSRLTPEGMLAYSERTLSEARERMIKGKTKEWIEKHEKDFTLTDEEAEAITRRVVQAADMPEGRDRDILLGEINSIIQSKIPTNLSKGYKAWRRISMLLNLRTNVRNVLGNAIITPEHIFGDLIGSGIDKAIATKTGVRTTGRLHAGEAVKGLKKGAYESWDDFARKINTRGIDNDRWETGDGPNFSTKTRLGRALNALDRTCSFLLDFGDRPFFQMWFINSLNNQMRLNNVTEPTAGMIEIATQEALQRTWQDENGYTKMVSGFRRNLNILHIGEYGLGDMILPFVKTPANLTKAIVDFSPIGLTKALTNDAIKFSRAISTGQVTPKMQRDFVRNLSQGITGTIFMLIAALLANAGSLSGGGDDDKDVAAFEKNVLGIMPYSVKIGDRSYSYEWAQPVASNAAIMADIVKIAKSGKYTKFVSGKEKADMQNIILSALGAGGSIILNQSFLGNLQNFFGGSGSVSLSGDGLIKGLIDTAVGEPATLIPTLFSQVAQATDDTARTSWEYQDYTQTAINKVMAKLVGARSTLAPSVDVLGREVEANNDLFNVFVNPANFVTAKPTPESEEMYRLYKSTGDKGVIPSVAPYYVKYNDEKYVLNSKSRAEYQKTMGTVASDGVKELMQKSAYRKLPDEEKAAVIKKLYTYAESKAKSNFIDGYYPQDSDAKMAAASGVGVSPAEYLLFMEIKDGNSYAASEEAISKMGGLSEKKKAILWQLADISREPKKNPYKDKIAAENIYNILQNLKRSGRY